MSRENQRKRHRDRQTGRPSDMSSSDHPASKRNSGSGLGLGSGSGSISTKMSEASITNKFGELSSRHEGAQDKYNADVEKRRHNYNKKKSDMKRRIKLELQELADNAKPKEAQQEKNAKIEEMAHDKIEEIDENFKERIQRAESLETPEGQNDAKKARRARNEQRYRARQDARRKLSDSEEVDAIALTPEGEETILEYKKMLQEAKEDLKNDLIQLELEFRGKIKDIMDKQQELSGSMDAENFGKVEEDVEEARAMVQKTQSAQQIIESMRALSEDPFLKAKDTGGEKKASGKGKGRA